MMEHLNMQSMDKVAANVAKIRELFPNCVTERINKEGKLEHAIDFDMLKQELSDHVVDGLQERYQFTWPDKRRAILAANAPINKTLRPCREESVDFDNTENLYIEGDNLEVLKLLQETYLGKVKMIYIDPPYNTGNDFVYRDEFKQNASEYKDNSGQYDEKGNQMVTNTESNGRFHTDWLNMIYPRLKVAKDLLSEDGVIFISIDDNEVKNMISVCNEIFGEENLVATIPWQSRASIQNDTDFSVNHEYIMVYAKVRRQVNRRLKESNYKEWMKKDSFVCKPLPVDKSRFSNPDNDPRGAWKADPFDAPNVRPNLTYEITNPNTGEKHLPPRGRCWRTDVHKFASALADNRIIFGVNGLGRPQLKVFYEEKKMFGSIDNSWFSADRIGTTTNGTQEVMVMFDNIKLFDTPKPTTLLNKLLYLSNLEKDSLILDFFSGSATTAHAVMQLNAEDGGKRKFIMVQLQEECAENSEAYKAGYKNICEIGKERIRRAGKKIKEENPLTTQDLDIGFRVLKCDSSNMEDVYFTPKEYMDKQQSLFVDNIKKDRSDEDLLFDAMLKLDTPLSSKIEKITIAGKTVYNVAQGHLMACFDKNVTDEVITAIAKEMPSYFVMRDSSQADDSVAINFEQIFNTYSPQTVRRVL
ncbi:site-specific DNA-methyltransferase [uncultured Phascolarctobacterium sp.]|uniref:site-specific DNA-methyltransferase n=1 Tax=uncultured Phascolarctobacterium sp. TaxID=512296 RepID=UPI0025E26B4F|nr:site-specific DNA-methyltransferase [uncultured Phascolarctobacterium sp.]